MDGGADQWITRARQGDQQAFRRLVDANADALYQLCVRITRDPALAEDAVQETFYRAWRSLDAFDGRAAFSTWVYRIAANAALEQLRREACAPTSPFAPNDAEAIDGGDFLAAVPDESPGPEAHAEGAETGVRIGRLMRRLSAIERAAFVMRHHDGERLDAIAAALSLTTEQCKHAIFRAVRKLRDALDSAR